MPWFWRVGYVGLFTYMLLFAVPLPIKLGTYMNATTRVPYCNMLQVAKTRITPTNKTLKNNQSKHRFLSVEFFLHGSRYHLSRPVYL